MSSPWHRDGYRRRFKIRWKHRFLLSLDFSIVHWTHCSNSSWAKQQRKEQKQFSTVLWNRRWNDRPISTSSENLVSSRTCPFSNYSLRLEIVKWRKHRHWPRILKSRNDCGFSVDKLCDWNESQLFSPFSFLVADTISSRVRPRTRPSKRSWCPLASAGIRFRKATDNKRNDWEIDDAIVSQRWN